MAMLQILVFRHAKTERDAGVIDHDRALTDRGRRNARAMGGWLAEEDLVPDLALVSDAKRTRQTFEIARAAFPVRMRTVSDPDLYHASEDAILASVRTVAPGPRRILICGHNPGLHDFTTALVGAGDRAALDLFRDGFPTAGIAVLALEIAAWSDLRWRAARLDRFVTPQTVAGDPGDRD